MSPRTNSHVAGHLGVRLPATPAPQGALDNEELFIVEGSKNPRTAGLNPSRGSPKNGAKCAEKAPNPLQIVIELCRSTTESEAPPVLRARTGMSTTLSVNATALHCLDHGQTVVHKPRKQPCSRTALWNLSSVAQLECPALCRGTESRHRTRTTWTAGTQTA